MTSLTARLFASCKRLARDQRGTASAEFVIMLPLMMGILVMMAEYGNGMMQREALDTALRDATRLLTRAPLSPVDDTGAVNLDSEGNPVPYIQPYFALQAERTIAERVGVSVEDLQFSARATVIPAASTVATRRGTERNEDVVLITTQAVVPLNLRLLNFIDGWIGGAIENAERTEGREIDPERVETTFSMVARNEGRYVSRFNWNERACPLDVQGTLCTANN